MLEYYKTILTNVSFDVGLFRKELKKALRHLKPEEATSLKEWFKQTKTK